jgi:hypothetical protein
MLTSLCAIVVLAAVGVYLQQQIGERAAIRTARESAALITRGIVQPFLTEQALAGAGPDRAALDHIIRTRVLDRTIVRVKVWARDGTILYSDDARLVGARFPLGVEELEVIASGRTLAGISDLSAPENRFEQTSERLLEVYRPVRVAGTGRVVLFEF